MKTYQITIKHLFDNKEYTGTFTQEPDMPGVELQALEYYAEELNTSYEDLEIIKTTLIK